MDYENKYKASNADATPEEKDASAEPNKHKYRLLGESGLVEDEDGNVYDASEIDDSSDFDGLTNS